MTQSSLKLQNKSKILFGHHLVVEYAAGFPSKNNFCQVKQTKLDVVNYAISEKEDGTMTSCLQIVVFDIFLVSDAGFS